MTQQGQWGGLEHVPKSVALDVGRKFKILLLYLLDHPVEEGHGRSSISCPKVCQTNALGCSGVARQHLRHDGCATCLDGCSAPESTANGEAATRNDAV
eukprot:158793-Chlamydomonas_euryale.AAC.10